ncbi:MAG TPA: hypothetical protein VIM21_01170 [Gemmatimonadaceae bacterium]
MPNRDLNDNRKSVDKRADDIPEARPGWKSKWVESTPPAARHPIERPDDVRFDVLRENAPEVDDVPREGGEETANG